MNKEDSTNMIMDRIKVGYVSGGEHGPLAVFCTKRWVWISVLTVGSAVILGCVYRRLMSSRHGQRASTSHDSSAVVESKSKKRVKEGRGRVEVKLRERFGYEFEAETGVLTDVDTSGGFEFDVFPSKAQNQKRYEALGELITEYVFEILEQKEGLEKIIVPVDASEEEPVGFFFASKDAWKKEELVVLIHGSGVVRAGQWSRRLIINDGLYTGTQIPYIEEALQRDMGVVVLNTNYNRDKFGNTIRGNGDSCDHAIYVWHHFISSSKAKKIAIVAHSAGGYVTNKLAENEWEDFETRVKAVCFTDSAHMPSQHRSWAHIKKVGRDWVTSKAPLDTTLEYSRREIEMVSAGTLNHEETSPYAMHSVWRFIDKRFE